MREGMTDLLPGWVSTQPNKRWVHVRLVSTMCRTLALAISKQLVHTWMKTFKHLYDTLTSFPNLLAAYERARKGKRSRDAVARFDWHLERNLIGLQERLRGRTYRPGRYRSFYVYEPKRRLVSAAPFIDRVVHHALCRVIEPIFEPRFIYDSYACRTGKGTHRAVRRFCRFMGQNQYVFKTDIWRYFPSIDHAILQDILNRRLVDDNVRWLIATILSSGNGILAHEYIMQWFPGDDLFAVSRPRGLPIGNLTSQFFGNVYLHELDAFIKHDLRCRHYIRYCDDFAIFSPSKHMLHDIRQEIERFLERLRLRLHPQKTLIQPVAVGTEFLGYRIYPTHIRISKANVKRFVRRMRHHQMQYQQGQLSVRELGRAVQ